MANTEGVNIVITGDSSQAVEAVKKVTKAIKSVKDTSIKVTADTSSVVSEAEKAASAVGSIADAHAEITVDSSQAVDATNKAADAMGNIENAHAEITADGSKATDEINKVADAEENVNDAHVEITADGSQAENEINNVSGAIENLADKDVKITVDNSQAVSAVMSIQEAIEHLDRKSKLKLEFSDADIKRQLQKVVDYRLNNTFSKKFARNFTEFSKASDDFFKRLESGFGTIFKSITAGAASVTGAIGMVMKSALSIGSGFESEITNVKVISGATEQELDMLVKKAREMGATLPITAQNAATAMKLLAQRGTSAKDILASVADVANLAISQGIDMGSAADILGSTLTNFGISIDNAAKVTAVFNNACNQSALSMSKLIEAMRYVGPAAGAVGMNLTEAVSAMEAIANAGLTGEMTGTGFAMVLSKIASESHIMGVRTKELDGSLRPLKNIFTELKAAGLSYTEATAIFGQRGNKAALALINYSDKLAENEERLKQWGTTQNAVDEKTKTFTNTMATLQSAVEELHIEVFEQIKEQSKGAVSGVAELTRTFSEWVQKTQLAGKALNSFLEGLGFRIPAGSEFKRLLDEFNVSAFVERIKEFGKTLRGIGDSIVSLFDKIKTPLSWLINNLDTFAAISFWGWILSKGLRVPLVIVDFATSFLRLYNVLKGFSLLNLSSLFAFLTNPITLTVAGVAAAAGGIAYVINSLDNAQEELRHALEQKREYLFEQETADLKLPVEIKLKFKTGFEKLPESYIKASDKVREKVDTIINDLQDNFKHKFYEAVLAVIAHFPELADSFTDAAGNIVQVSDDMLRKVSAAVYGSKEAFEALPEGLKKVTEHIKIMNLAEKTGSKFYTNLLSNYQLFRKETEKPIKKTEAQTFFEELNANVRNITSNVSGEIERTKNFLSSSDGQLPVNVSLDQTKKKIESFVKTVADKYNVSEEVAKTGVLDSLNALTAKGDFVAQSLVNAFDGVGTSLETFLTNAQEAIDYLGASPDKFMPALNQMMKGIQRIDPMTGKLTEKFKKAHDALKQWANTSFNQLTNRIQRLRRAVEGGFINKSALEAEFNRVTPQIKMQVVAELEPMREQFRTEKDYQAVIASEFISKIEDMFGDIGVGMARRMFNGMTGSGMGRAILAEVGRGFSNTPDSSKTFLKINGVDILQKSVDSLSKLPQNISNAVQPYVAKVEQLNTQPQNISPVNDYSSVITAIVREIQASSQANVTAVNGVTSAVQSVETAVKGISIITETEEVSKDNDSTNFKDSLIPLTDAVQNLSAAVAVIQSQHQANSAAITQVIAAVQSLENAVKSSSTGNTYDIDITQQGFTIEKRSDANTLARSTANTIRAGIGNGGI